MKPEAIISKTLQHEGGYSNHVADKGGPTNYGITLKTFKQVSPGATVADLKNLTGEDVIGIYKDLYFYTPGVDKLPKAIQDLVFDMNVLHGASTATRLLQKALRYLGHAQVTVDADLGPKTIKAAFNTNPVRLRAAINKQREALINSIVERNPSQKVFLNGWMRRVNSFKEMPTDLT
jgi:lysozyme family protein